MKNIDKELIDWATKEIKTKYSEDVALLIGQKGACKTPEDEQNMAFDFYVPATDRGFQLAKTFIIEDMGYDLYPMTWERLEGIAEFNEPRVIFAVMKGEVIYARTEEDRQRYENIKKNILKNLTNKDRTFKKALESLNTAMEIYQTMMFENSLCTVRKAAGGISCFLVNAIAMVNGQYLINGYGNLTTELARYKATPDHFQSLYIKIFEAKDIASIQEICHELIRVTRDFFMKVKSAQSDENKKSTDTDKSDTNDINYNDLADWYQEARYTFRRIDYYAKINSLEDCFSLGCYLQIEFDAIQDEFNLAPMDLLGVFDSNNLAEFAERANTLEKYISGVLTSHHAELKIYSNLQEFLDKQ